MPACELPAPCFSSCKEDNDLLSGEILKNSIFFFELEGTDSDETSARDLLSCQRQLSYSATCVGIEKK